MEEEITILEDVIQFIESKKEETNKKINEYIETKNVILKFKIKYLIKQLNTLNQKQLEELEEYINQYQHIKIIQMLIA